jgi:Cu2+-exporting ATPase
MMMTVTHMLHRRHPKILSSAAADERFCRHCETLLPRELEDDYCCHGCRSAHTLIETFELNRFYEIVQENNEGLRPARVQRSDYKLFDAPIFQDGFVESKQDGQKTAHFYLDNMSCYACVWVCEQLVRKLDSEAQLAINLATGEATLAFDSSRHDLSHFLQHFEALGFGVSPNRTFTRDNRREVARIGVALFCLMNIMMLAFPEYLGASSLEDRFRDLFRWISMVLAALAVFYSGWPLLAGGVYAVHKRSLHLDLPIALALIVCYAYSVYNTVRGHAFVYYDTTTAVVALLLIGRFVQGQALSRVARQQSQYLEGDYRLARVQAGDGSEEMKALVQVVEGDVLRLLPGEVVPIDGILLSPSSELHYALLTGESDLHGIIEGQTVLAGAVNGSRPMLLRAAQPGVQSYLLRLQKASQALHHQKGHYLGLSEKLAKGFVAFVLMMAALNLLLWFPFSPSTAIERFAAVLLVACPCIFGFGAPLVIARAFHLGMQRGVLFRSQRALERLSEVERFYFDKTGTLTEDESRIVEAHWNQLELRKMQLDPQQVQTLLRRLPEFARHHVITALTRWLGPGDAREETQVKAIREYFGQGLSLVWNGHDVRLGRYGFCVGREPDDPQALEYSYLVIDGAIVLQFKLSETLRPEATATLQSLVSQGRHIYMLTGDATGRAQDVGQALGIDVAHIAARLNPQDKEQQIVEGERSAMVGNGINDALAVSKVSIGIAVESATDALKEKADVVLAKPGLQPILDALKVSERARTIMQRCFFFAILFNGVGMTLAVGGWATPVLAAILMPISSLTIFTIAQRWSVTLRVGG